MTDHSADELAKIEQAIGQLQALLDTLGDDPELQAKLASLQEQKQTLLAQDSQLEGGDHAVVGSQAGRDINTGTVIYAEGGSRVVVGSEKVEMEAVDPETALGHYLQYLISHNRYLRLQGIRSGGRLVSIELDQIYITLRATKERLVEAGEAWLEAEACLAPGERHRRPDRGPAIETVTVSVNEALADSRRLVILGDPGSGKTTLLRYLTLLYARDMADQSGLIQDKLGVTESGHLPVLLYLRRLGAYLKARRPADDGTEGPGLVLNYLRESLAEQRLKLPADFFEEWLTMGRAVLLLDGLDEVADPDLRRRISRLVEAFCRSYPGCRYVVASRVVGYSGPVRLGEDFALTTVRDFTMADVERFLTNWHRLIAVAQMGPVRAAGVYAATQTAQLKKAIEANERVRELAINPLMLTVIAMVHRDRVKLPDRRAELYHEAVDVLLGKWDETKGIGEQSILPEGQLFDTRDRRLTLQSLALHMQEAESKEIAAGDLRAWLRSRFETFVADGRRIESSIDRFLRVIEERTGLLVARGEGVYAFSHLTFQEYLAALEVAGRDDYIDYVLSRASEAWWREVILLVAGYLSMENFERTTRLIRAIAEKKAEPEPYHNLVLAAECLRDVGGHRVQGDLERDIQTRLKKELEDPTSKGWLSSIQMMISRRLSPKTITERRIAAAQALARISRGIETYWSRPYGEPEWVEIPAGEFWMGSEAGPYDDEKPLHRLHLERFLIARTPVTNAQYHLFTQATGHPVPAHWEDGRPPKRLESHPVVNVSWHEAMAYCRWLGEMTGKPITLPGEAEWEKAARGDKDKREYPWGDTFEASRCNSSELGLGQTTPVGIFPNGASPYGCLDMAGNVWEWTRSLWGKKWEKPDFGYPYDAGDGREDLEAGDEWPRVLRGGSFLITNQFARCAVRYRFNPSYGDLNWGFRVLLSPFFTSAL